MWTRIPVFVVNLERDAERRRYMTDLLQSRGLAATFLPAVDGSRLGETDWAIYDRRRSLRIYGVEMLASELGCYLSHYRLYERLLREKILVALVLEDDIAIDPDFTAVIDALLDDPTPSWLMVRLLTLRPRVANPTSRAFAGTKVKDLSPGRSLYRLSTHVLGTGGYLIRTEGARRLLDYGRHMFMPIDHTIDRFWENGILPYVVRPFPLRHLDTFGTSIGTRAPERRHGQPPAIRLARRVNRLKDSVRKRLFNLTH